MEVWIISCAEIYSDFFSVFLQKATVLRDILDDVSLGDVYKFEDVSDGDIDEDMGDFGSNLCDDMVIRDENDPRMRDFNPVEETMPFNDLEKFLLVSA